MYVCMYAVRCTCAQDTVQCNNVQVAQHINSIALSTSTTSLSPLAYKGQIPYAKAQWHT